MFYGWNPIILINSGANPNLVQDDGLSPLHAAVIRQNILIVKLLLKSGADPNIKTKIYNQSPVHIAIKNDVDPMILLVLIQFNGSLLERDKFEKRYISFSWRWFNTMVLIILYYRRLYRKI